MDFINRGGGGVSLILKKLWSCVGVEVKHKTLVLSTELKEKSGHRREIESWCFERLSSRQSESFSPSL